MIKELIQERLRLTGTMNQASFANKIGASAGQVSLFFNGSASLSNEQYEKAFELVDIRLDTYRNRYELAKAVAKELVNQGYTLQDIKEMDKDEMAEISHKKEVLCFIDTNSEEQFNAYISSEIIEPECLFVVFKSLVMLSFETLNINLTPKQVSKSYERIVEETNLSIGIAVAGLAATAILIGSAATLLRNKAGGLSTLIGLGKNILKE